MKIILKLSAIRIRIQTILFLGLLVTPTTSSTKDTLKMYKLLSNIVSDLVPSDQNVYFNFGENSQRTIQKKLVMTLDAEGIALAAPVTLDLSLNNIIPILWLQLSSALRNWQVEEKRNSFLIISDLCNDIYFIRYAYAGRPKRFDFKSIPLSLMGNQPSSPQGFTSSAERLDCKTIMGNPSLKSTTLAITMTQYDWVSNTIQIKLIDSTGRAPEIPTISESVSRNIYNTYKAAAQNMKDSAIFSPSLKPLLVAQNGITAIVPQKVKKVEYRWMMHGIIRIPVAPGSLVATSETLRDSAIPSAIVTAMVIINKLDNKEPSWITIKLPVLTPCKAGDLADASFSVDLKRFNGQYSDVGVYQVFIACGAYVAGPFALEVVG
ncbi:MAG: hypothetical protein JW915_11290 [Chitinispirillaceae bacterium]|nr:hypothetical protein [Chitinispirillaceae bacterium]